MCRLGFDNAERLEAASIEPSIAGEERLGSSLGVRTHEEIGNHALATAAAPSILPPLSGGEVGAELVERIEADAGSRQGAPQVADVGEVRADFCPDDRTDHHTAEVARGSESPPGRGPQDGMVGQDVQKYGAVRRP